MLIPSGTVTNTAFLVTSQILSPPPLATVTRQLKTSSFLPIEQLPCFKDLKLTLKLEVLVEGEIATQKIEETKVALAELGLNNDIKTDID